MVNSTLVTAQMTNSDDLRKYYSIFINTMATIARNFEGKIIKNSGDSVIYYFPNTSDYKNEYAFRNVLECCLTMISANSVINDKLYEEALPPLKYRISSDYGRVQIAKSSVSTSDDLFGTTVNLCAKINKKAEPNTMIIGSDLYLVLKSISTLRNEYNFKSLGHYAVGFKQSYPLYVVTSKYDKPAIGDFMQIPELRPVEKYSNSLKMVDNLSPKKTQYGEMSYRIMLVDDDKDILTTFEALLNPYNFRVETFDDSNEALKNFAQAAPDYYDLVILDIRMPGLNGLQLYYRLKGIDKNIKVLFVSALDASEELLSILPGIELNNILKKPVDSKYLISTVNRLVKDVTEGSIENGK